VHMSAPCCETQLQVQPAPGHPVLAGLQLHELQGFAVMPASALGPDPTMIANMPKMRQVNAMTGDNKRTLRMVAPFRTTVGLVLLANKTVLVHDVGAMTLTTTGTSAWFGSSVIKTVGTSCDWSAAPLMGTRPMPCGSTMSGSPPTRTHEQLAL
jgi:hypothetical protein